MKFVPAPTNPCHPDFSKYSNTAKNYAQKLVLYYHAQGGTEYSCLQPWMVEDFKNLLEKMHEEYDKVWKKSWDILGKKETATLATG